MAFDAGFSFPQRGGAEILTEIDERRWTSIEVEGFQPSSRLFEEYLHSLRYIMNAPSPPGIAPLSGVERFFDILLYASGAAIGIYLYIIIYIYLFNYYIILYHHKISFMAFSCLEAFFNDLYINAFKGTSLGRLRASPRSSCWASSAPRCPRSWVPCRS